MSEQLPSKSKMVLDKKPILGTIVPNMGSKTSFDQLAPALFGKTRRAVLGLLFAHPEEPIYLREIIRRVGLGQGTVQRELDRLTESGLLTRRFEGRQVYYQANPNSPIFKELRSLLVKTAGVSDILRKALAKIKDRIHAAFLYGSLARGKDRSRSDIDLVVIGNVSFGEVVTSLRSTQEFLNREVNPTVYTPAEFQKKLETKHHFITTIVREPKIMLIGEERELTRLGKKRLGRKA